MKSVRTLNFSGPYFPPFELNKESYSVFGLNMYSLIRLSLILIFLESCNYYTTNVMSFVRVTFLALFARMDR